VPRYPYGPLVYPADPSIIDEYADERLDPVVNDELRAAVDSLPEPHRTVIEGLFWAGLTKAEIGRGMEPPLGRASVRAIAAEAFVLLRERVGTLPAADLGD
jgi:DNA-directed RNA polymerase specialized sigma24 family protein